MEVFIKSISPRKNDNGNVMNVEVEIFTPELEGRSNLVMVKVFIDKSVKSMDEIEKLARAKAFDLLKQIADHPV